jgi:hypothetical protein
MSDTPRQEPVPQEQTPPEAASPWFPPQEFFGSPFPESPAAFSPPPPPGAPFAFAPPPIAGYPLPPQATYAPALPGPLPLAGALRQLPRQYWNVLTHPRAATFAWEQGKAAWNIIWVQLLILALFEALAVLVLLFLEFFLFQLFLPASAAAAISQALSTVALIAVLASVAFVLLSFFAGSGILYLVAKAFGGQGAFLPYVYSYALITVPLGILGLLFSLIPCLGSIAQLAGSIYALVLLIFMTMGVHHLGGGKASASVLIPLGIGILLVIAAYIAYLVWIFSLLSALPTTS